MSLQEMKNIFNKEKEKRDNIQQLLKMSDNTVKPKDITDNIINNVSDIHFKTFTNEQSKILVEVIKETLRRVRDINKDLEIALVYDLQGYVNQYGDWLFQETGKSDTDYIYLGANADIYHLLNDVSSKHVVVISHNHPNNRVISLYDIRTLVESENTHMVVAVTNSGKISYIVKESYNIDKFNKIKIEVSKVAKDNDEALLLLLNRCNEAGLYFYREG